MEIAVLGSESFTLGFRLAGIRKVILTEGKDYLSLLKTALDDREIGILIVNEEDIVSLPESWRNTLSDSVRPVVISVGKTGEEDIRQRIKRAIGIDLYRPSETRGGG